MTKLKIAGICGLVFYCCTWAGNTYSSFSVGLALPVTSTSVKTGTTEKKAGPGWDGAWTFFGKPFANSESIWSGLAFGGKISYSRWVRDSTYTVLSFVGAQGLARFYAPPVIKPFDLFGQVGGGLFVGEYGFGDDDTLVLKHPTDQTVQGKKNIGIHFGIGIDWDVIEFMPMITMVLTKDRASAWLSVNAGMKF